jgi:hypothetical protein
MLVILRDGRKLHGVLRSYDQFGMWNFLSIVKQGCSNMFTLRQQPTLFLKILSSEYITGTLLPRAGVAFISFVAKMLSYWVK